MRIEIKTVVASGLKKGKTGKGHKDDGNGLSLDLLHACQNLLTCTLRICAFCCMQFSLRKESIKPSVLDPGNRVVSNTDIVPAPRDLNK